MMHVAQANQKGLDNRISVCREAIQKIDDALSSHPYLGDAAIAHLVAAKMLIENQIAVHEASRCNIH